MKRKETVRPGDRRHAQTTRKDAMKKKPMLKVMVPVAFTGAVEVEVPAALPQDRRDALARKVALARVVATTDNPDAPEDDACEEYQAELGLDEATAGRNWDACKTAGVSGQWSLQPAEAVVQRLVDKAEAAGLQPGDLDDLVHDLASGVASDTNNGGLDEQFRYLVEALGVEDAERQLDELVEGKRKGEE
jgi:hypothetical protein